MGFVTERSLLYWELKFIREILRILWLYWKEAFCGSLFPVFTIFLTKSWKQETLEMKTEKENRNQTGPKILSPTPFVR